MDPYLDSLNEMRREAMSSLKSALGHVGSIVALVNSLNDQIRAENATRSSSSAVNASPPDVAAPTSINAADPVAEQPTVSAQEFSAASSPRDNKTAWSRAEPDTTLKEPPMLTVARREIIYNIKDEPVDCEEFSGADPLDLTAPKSPQEADRQQPARPEPLVTPVQEQRPPPLQPTVRLEQLRVAGRKNNKKPAKKRKGEGLSEEQYRERVRLRKREASKRWLRQQRDQLEGRVLRMRCARNYFPEEESVKSERRQDDE